MAGGQPEGQLQEFKRNEVKTAEKIFNFKLLLGERLLDPTGNLKDFRVMTVAFELSFEKGDLAPSGNQECHSDLSLPVFALLLSE